MCGDVLLYAETRLGCDMLTRPIWTILYVQYAALVAFTSVAFVVGSAVVALRGVHVHGEWSVGFKTMLYEYSTSGQRAVAQNRFYFARSSTALLLHGSQFWAAPSV